jgi:hypothetical protein
MISTPSRAGAMALAVLGLVLAAKTVRADQRRDFMLDIQPSGTFLMLDYFGTGGQITLEHRRPIYGSANDIGVSAGLIPTYPLGEVFARADLRVLFLNFGASIAYRDVWRDLRFDAGTDRYCERCDAPSRRAKDPIFGATPTSDHFPCAEGEVSLLAPFNEHVVMQAAAALRYEGRHDRTFDWFYTSIYDHGILGRLESSLLFKDRRWGGIGPYLQLLMLPREDKHVSQFAAGFNAVSRLGLIARNDLLFLTFLIRPGDETFGQHDYYMPVRALLIYRMMLEL